MRVERWRRPRAGTPAEQSCWEEKTLTYGWMKVVIGDVGDTPFLPPLESFR